MPHWRKLFNTKYLGSWDFENEDGSRREATLTIAKVESVELRGQSGEPEKKALVTFEKAKKPMVMCKTDCRTVAGMYGKNTAEWIGKKITLYVADVSAFGETVPAIRVRPEVPA